MTMRQKASIWFGLFLCLGLAPAVRTQTHRILSLAAPFTGGGDQLQVNKK